MHAYLLVNPDTTFVDSKIRQIAGAARVIHFKVEKIADTRELVRQTNMSLPAKTVYLLEDFDDASTEAQNAFLKRLEEPAENLLFFLIAKNESRVLPTILSRCEVLRASAHDTSTKKSKDNARQFINSSIPEKFLALSKISKREDAVMFLEELLHFLHTGIPKHAYNMKLIDQTLMRINQNANPTLQLTRLAVSLQ